MVEDDDDQRKRFSESREKQSSVRSEESLDIDESVKKFPENEGTSSSPSSPSRKQVGI